jgi:hypothetical protein
VIKESAHATTTAFEERMKDMRKKEWEKKEKRTRVT